MKLPLLLALAASPALTPGDHGTCPSSGYAAGSPDIVETAVAAEGFGTLVRALEAAGLVDALKGDGPFTVFAPTDAAFAALPKGELEALLRPENVEKLRAVLTYHVVPGDLDAVHVLASDGLATLNGQRLAVRTTDDGAFVDGARISKTDVGCSNGRIHVIDSVLLPSFHDVVGTASSDGRFTTLAKALEVAGLVEALRAEGPFTVFAPTDEAFAALPEGTLESLLRPENVDQLRAILLNHVVAGRVWAADAMGMHEAATLQGSELPLRTDEHGVLRVGGAGVVLPDVDATNGVIHAIDAVILPE